MLIRISVCTIADLKRPPLQVLPTLWFRNTWSCGRRRCAKPSDPARRRAGSHPGDASRVACDYWLYCEGVRSCSSPRTKPTTAAVRGSQNASPYVKDAFHITFVIGEEGGAVNPALRGTKAAAHYRLQVPAGESRSVRLRLIGSHGPAIRSAASKRPSGSESARRTNSITDHPEDAERGSAPRACARRWRECSGASSFTTST